MRVFVKKIGALVLALSCLVLFSACASDHVQSSEPDPIVGSWEGEGSSGISLHYDDCVFDAAEDGAVSMSFASNDHSGNTLELNFEGTWKSIDSIPDSSLETDGHLLYQVDFSDQVHYVTLDQNDENETICLFALNGSGKMDTGKALLTAERASEKEPVSRDDIDAQISQQPVVVSSVEYLVQDENYKALYPDFLMATVQNNSGAAIKHVTLGYIAWDENGLPIKIYSKGNSGFYYIECSMSDVNIPNGESWAERGVALSSTNPSDIATFKAIVVSYTDYDGNTWENPLLNDWQEVYENQPL